MIIDFKKVHYSPLDFNIKLEYIRLKGKIKYHSKDLLVLDAILQGTIRLDCDLCGFGFVKLVDEQINFLISDGVYSPHNNNFEVIELLNGIIDVDKLLNSEIELLKSDYHICNDCKLKERN